MDPHTGVLPNRTIKKRQRDPLTNRETLNTSNGKSKFVGIFAVDAYTV